MRLTKKNNGYYVKDNGLAIDKLGQLEDIEDKLGIDLITLFNEINGTKAYEIISGIADAIKRKLEH